MNYDLILTNIINKFDDMQSCCEEEPDVYQCQYRLQCVLRQSKMIRLYDLILQHMYHQGSNYVCANCKFITICRPWSNDRCFAHTTHSKSSVECNRAFLRRKDA